MTLVPPPRLSLDCCLFLDVDGTLVELADTPYEARVDDALKRLLGGIAGFLDGALALVSGRSIEYLDVLFAPLRVPCAGLHGVERRSAGGAMHGSLRSDPRLEAARVRLAALVREHPGTLLEDKGRTLAVHFRLAPASEAAVRSTVQSVAAGLASDYHVQAGNLMLEIKPCGYSKGAAVQAFLGEAPFAGRRPVYVGDDLTDIDGFRAVDAAGGTSIAVGNRVTARYHLRDPAAVREWLAQVGAS